MRAVIVLLAVISLAYNAYAIIRNRGVPESLSATAYVFGERRWLFSAYCAVLSAGLLPVWLEVSEDKFRWLVFLCCGGILFAGATPYFRDKETIDSRLHYVAGGVAFVSYAVWLVLSGHAATLVAASVASAVLTVFDRRDWVFYMETLALVSLFVVIFLQYLSL